MRHGGVWSQDLRDAANDPVLINAFLSGIGQEVGLRKFHAIKKTLALLITMGRTQVIDGVQIEIQLGTSHGLGIDIKAIDFFRNKFFGEGEGDPAITTTKFSDHLAFKLTQRIARKTLEKGEGPLFRSK